MFALTVVAATAARPGHAQSSVDYQDVGGIRYQIQRTEVPTSIPVTEMRDQQQTIYRQQVTTDNVAHQQVYNVPITQYQIVSRLHGRWNPFITPYWTHHYEPVTVWQQQVATVQIPVTRVGWAPETRTVQQPVTTWKTASRFVETRTPIGATPTGGSGTALAGARPSAGTPSATLTPNSGATASLAQRPVGGEAMQNDPPKQASGWQPPSTASSSTSRY
jgi:hypothetical protein